MAKRRTVTLDELVSFVDRLNKYGVDSLMEGDYPEPFKNIGREIVRLLDELQLSISVWEDALIDQTINNYGQIQSHT